MTTTERIKELIESGSYLLDREDACRMTILALASDESIFLYGPPGTAKSLTAKWTANLLDTKKYFSCLLNQYTQPDELFGPVSIKSLESGTREILTQGYMPEAEIAFLDEIWKAGPAILNTLLTICNEKTFKNGNQTINVPLKLLISASNEFPSEDAGMEALYDRFLIRIVVEPVSRKDSFVRLVTGRKNFDEEIKVNPISQEELSAWKTGSENIAVPKEITDFLFSLRLRMNERGLYISDRRWKKIVNLLKTCAFLNGRKKVAFSDLFIIENTLWNYPEERKEIEECVKQSVTIETVKGSFLFTERITGVIEKLKLEKDSVSNYEELSEKIDSECSYLASLKTELENAKNGGEGFWKNVFSGLSSIFERTMMEIGIEKLKEFISNSEGELEEIRFSSQPKVKEVFDAIPKNAPTVILNQTINLKAEKVVEESKNEIPNSKIDKAFESQLDAELDAAFEADFEENVEENVVENFENKAVEPSEESATSETVNFENENLNSQTAISQSSKQSSKNENPVSEESNLNLQNQSVVVESQIAKSENQEMKIEVPTGSDSELMYKNALHNIKTFEEFIKLSGGGFTGDQSDIRYKWNDNKNNGAKWWKCGSRFLYGLLSDKGIVQDVENECAKKGATIGSDYHWIYAISYIFEKNDGLLNWKTRAELEWLTENSWEKLEKILESEFL